MSSDEAPPPAGLRTSLLRNAAGALGVVVFVAAAFWGIGALQDDEGTPVVAGDPDEPDADETTEPPVEDEAPEEEPTPDPEPAEPEPDDGDGATDGEGGEDDATEDADAEEDDADADADDDGTDEPERSVPPGEVSIQVLDGYKADGGAAADEVASLLGDAGYAVVARNDALTYDVTTVLYNPGHEAAARQVAAELGGATEVREQPGNLSSAVDLHVVVGRDRG